MITLFFFTKKWIKKSTKVIMIHPLNWLRNSDLIDANHNMCAEVSSRRNSYKPGTQIFDTTAKRHRENKFGKKTLLKKGISEKRGLIIRIFKVIETIAFLKANFFVRLFIRCHFLEAFSTFFIDSTEFVSRSMKPRK